MGGFVGAVIFLLLLAILGWQAGILGSSSAEMKALGPFICENDIGKKCIKLPVRIYERTFF